MIKIICPICGSDEIDDISTEQEKAKFICDICDFEFEVGISDDMWEFDTK